MSSKLSGVGVGSGGSSGGLAKMVNMKRKNSLEMDLFDETHEQLHHHHHHHETAKKLTSTQQPPPIKVKFTRWSLKGDEQDEHDIRAALKPSGSNNDNSHDGSTGHNHHNNNPHGDGGLSSARQAASASYQNYRSNIEYYRLKLSKSKLKAVTRTSALLSGKRINTLKTTTFFLNTV